MTECEFCLATRVDGEIPEYRDQLGVVVCDPCWKTLKRLDLVEEGPEEKHPLHNGEFKTHLSLLDPEQMEEDDAEEYKQAVQKLMKGVSEHAEIAEKYSAESNSSTKPTKGGRE